MAIKRLTERHRQVALMVAAGRTPAEVGQALGMHENSIRRLLRDDQITGLIEQHRQAVTQQVVANQAERITQLTPLALDAMEDVLKNGPAGVKARVAADILDRNPEMPKRMIHSQHNQGDNAPRIVLDADFLRGVARAARLTESDDLKTALHEMQRAVAGNEDEVWEIQQEG